MTISQHLEAQAAHRPPLTPKNQIYLTEAEAHARIAAALHQWLPVPHYCDTDYFVDQHDIDRVAAIIRRLGRQGHLKFDE
jgi:hypothetical protein